MKAKLDKRTVAALALPEGKNDEIYWCDALDRFGTRLEHRMTLAQIRTMMESAGLSEIRFSDAVPFWCSVGRKI